MKATLTTMCAESITLDRGGGGNDLAVDNDSDGSRRRGGVFERGY
jgi:hypothetical protein